MMTIYRVKKLQIIPSVEKRYEDFDDALNVQRNVHFCWIRPVDIFSLRIDVINSNVFTNLIS